MLCADPGVPRRARVPTGEPIMIDPNEILRVVHEASTAFDATLTDDARRARAARRHNDIPEELVPYPADHREDALYEFELATAAEALLTLGEDIEAECERRKAEAYRMALHVYYTMEEMVRDPANAELIPQLETLRAAHEREYGKPIPAKDL
jgi:hypothetical protein